MRDLNLQPTMVLRGYDRERNHEHRNRRGGEISKENVEEGGGGHDKK